MRVAVGVDLQIVDGEVVHAGGQNGEVPAVQDRDVAQGHVAAILQADGFVAHSVGEFEVTISAAQALAPDQPLALDGNILQVFAPDQAVVPVAVAKILKFVPGVGLGRIVAAARARGRRVGSHDGRARVEKQSDVALQVDGVAEIISRREAHDAAACRGCRVDRFIDSGRVQSFAVAGGAESSYVESAPGGRVCLCLRNSWLNRGGCSQRRAGNPGACQLQKVSSLGGLGKHDSSVWLFWSRCLMRRRTGD